MAIRHLPPTPNPYERETFEEKAWNFLCGLEPWGQDVDAMGQQVATDREITEQLKIDTQAIKEAAVDETTAIKNAGIASCLQIKEEAIAETTAIKDMAAAQKQAAVAAKQSAIQARDEAWNLTHYKGAWSSLSGTLAIPASVSHNKHFWALLVDVADVTAEVPGESDKWHRITSLEAAYIPMPPGAAPQPAEWGFVVAGDRNNANFVDIAGLGRFVWDEEAVDPVDGETCLLTDGQPENLPGRWLMVEPGWASILAETLRVSDEIKYKMENQ